MAICALNISQRLEHQSIQFLKKKNKEEKCSCSVIGTPCSVIDTFSCSGIGTLSLTTAHRLLYILDCYILLIYSAIILYILQVYVSLQNIFCFLSLQFDSKILVSLMYILKNVLFSCNFFSAVKRVVKEIEKNLIIYINSHVFH